LHKTSDAYFSAFIFYFLLNAFLDYKIRREALKEIEGLVRSLTQGAQSLFTIMGENANVTWEHKFPSEEHVYKVCSNLSWYKKVLHATTGSRKATWLEVLISERKRGLKFISQIKEQNRTYRDMKLESITTQIKYCNLYTHLSIISQMDKIGMLSNSQLDDQALKEYVRLIEQLEDYM
jgi:hypothetical protein